MKNETIYADFILAETERRIRLEAKVNSSRLDYYFKGSLLLALTFGMIVGAGILFLPSVTEFPLPVIGLVIFTSLGLAEAKRNSDRMDALLKLRELDQSKTCEPGTVVNASSPSGNSKKQLND
jgi:hypothetical protein